MNSNCIEEEKNYSKIINIFEKNKKDKKDEYNLEFLYKIISFNRNLILKKGFIIKNNGVLKYKYEDPYDGSVDQLKFRNILIYYLKYLYEETNKNNWIIYLSSLIYNKEIEKKIKYFNYFAKFMHCYNIYPENITEDLKSFYNLKNNNIEKEFPVKQIYYKIN